MSTTFTIGDKVRLSKAGLEHHGFQSEGSDGTILRFEPRDSHSVWVKWDANGHENRYRPDQLTLVKQLRPIKRTLNLSHLDKLVVSDDIKQNIISVITQSSKRDLIFDTWGLGETVEYGKGMAMLFYGPPGTGKTWGAHCIAKAVGRELLVITVGQIQSSMAGETNKNIEAAFQEAKEKDAVLFLDEVDSFIADRRHLGMILGSEINTLLTQIEQFEGFTILATNQIGNLDPALERRLALIAEFPKPTKAQREQIWKTLLPKKFPLGKDVTPELLSEHKLTGGVIKNVLLAAARLAASQDQRKVTMDHFNRAIETIKASENKMGTRDRSHGVVDYQRVSG